MVGGVGSSREEEGLRNVVHQEVRDSTHLTHEQQDRDSTHLTLEQQDRDSTHLTLTSKVTLSQNQCQWVTVRGRGAGL